MECIPYEATDLYTVSVARYTEKCYDNNCAPITFVAVVMLLSE